MLFGATPCGGIKKGKDGGAGERRQASGITLPLCACAARGALMAKEGQRTSRFSSVNEDTSSKAPGVPPTFWRSAKYCRGQGKGKLRRSVRAASCERVCRSLARSARATHLFHGDLLHASALLLIHIPIVAALCACALPQLQEQERRAGEGNASAVCHHGARFKESFRDD
jgi:hypothetical protein